MEKVKKKDGKIISFMNMKGGVGKTSLCVNLAVILAKKYKKKILIVDMDPQMNATQYLFKKEIYDKEFFEKKNEVRLIGVQLSSILKSNVVQLSFDDLK